jgi:hypothetical protein
MLNGHFKTTLLFTLMLTIAQSIIGCAKDGAAGATGPAGAAVSNISANYVNGATQSIGNSAMTIVNFDTKTFDSDNAVSTGSSWKFTAPTTGLYSFDVSVRIGTGCSWTAATTRQLQLLGNGSVVIADLDFASDTISHTHAVTLRGSTMLRLTANDFVSAQVYQDTGGTCTINTGLATSISIARIAD